MRKRWAAGVRVRIEALFLPLSNGRNAGTRVSNENRTQNVSAETYFQCLKPILKPDYILYI